MDNEYLINSLTTQVISYSTGEFGVPACKTMMLGASLFVYFNFDFGVTYPYSFSSRNWAWCGGA